MTFVQGSLQMRQVLGRPDCFNRSDFVPFHLHCIRQARPNRPSVNQYGASATNAMLASDMRSGEMTVFTQSIRQKFSWSRFEFDVCAVDSQRHSLKITHGW
jgi:hypothetical protein